MANATPCHETVLDACGPVDTLWLLGRVGDSSTTYLFAADCAEHALPAFEERFPGDRRPRRAIIAAREHARGARTDPRLADPRVDVNWDAKRAVEDVRDNVMAAAWGDHQSTPRGFESLLRYLTTSPASAGLVVEVG